MFWSDGSGVLSMKVILTDHCSQAMGKHSDDMGFEAMDVGADSP